MERKPFIAGGYTQQDWEILNGALIDLDFLEDYCETPYDRWLHVTTSTKPKWLKKK